MITATLASALSAQCEYVDALGRHREMTLQRPAGTKVKVLVVDADVAACHQTMIEFECGKRVYTSLDKLKDAVFTGDRRTKTKLNYKKINYGKRLQREIVDKINGQQAQILF